MIYRVTGKEPKDIVDWVAVGRPEEIVIPEGHVEPVRFVGIQASAANPVLVSGGDITVVSNLSYGVKFDDCRHFIFAYCNIKGGNIGVTLEKRTSDFELRHLIVTDSGAVGVLAKDDQALRGQFTMTGKIHHCKIGKSGTEGIYVGNSHWAEGKAHECENVEIYSNWVTDSGWDGIQLGSCTKGARIFDNEVINAGTKRATNQSNGIQIGEGTGGLCYNNKVTRTLGNGIIVLGLGDNIVFNNELSDCGENGIFADTRGMPAGNGFGFFSNTIIAPKGDCIRLYSKLFLNRVENNLLLRPGGAFLYLREGVKVTDSGNMKVR